MQSIIASILVFLLLTPLVLPEGLSILGVSEGPRTEAKSVKAVTPPLSLAVTDFSAYARQLGKAYADSFPFRDEMIRLGNLARLELFGESPVKSVIKGRDGWLFVNTEMELEDWLGVGLYEPEDLARCMETLKKRRDWLGARGIRLLIVAAPNKSTIYGEHLPQGYHKLASVTRLDQLAAAMEREGFDFLDLRQTLYAAKAERRAYWKTDTHWNGFGAFRGSQAIVERLRGAFPSLPPLREEDYRLVESDVSGGDIAQMLMLESRIGEHDIDVVLKAPARSKPAAPKGYKNPATLSGRDMIIRETGDPSLPRAVIFRDSFSSSAWPYLAERFNRSVFLWEHRFQPHIVEAEKPDVVIYEVVERYQRALFFEDGQ